MGARVNRILFEPEEVADGRVTFGGVRAAHVVEILHGEAGQTLKTGIVDGPIGTSVIERVTPVPGGHEVTARTDHSEQSLAPWVDLVLAPPRPRVLKRLLPQLAALGVGRIVLVGAKKVEKDFWGATLLKAENYRPLLVDGLMQAGTSALPRLETRRNFGRFLDEELDALLPSPRRIVAHPYGAGDGAGAALAPRGGSGRLTVAIGPEGGWTDEEVARLETHGFVRRSLGRRILRTDTATVAVLAQLMMTEDRA